MVDKVFTRQVPPRPRRHGGTIKESQRVLGGVRVGRAVNAAARDLAREAAQLENSGGREAAGPIVSWSSRLKLLRLTLGALGVQSATSHPGPGSYKTKSFVLLDASKPC